MNRKKHGEERKMEDDQKQIETDRQRAEVFDALGHPQAF